MAEQARNSSEPIRQNSRTRRNFRRSSAHHARVADAKEPGTSSSWSYQVDAPEIRDAKPVRRQNPNKNKEIPSERKETVPNDEVMYDFPCLGSMVPEQRYYSYNHEHSAYIVLINESYKHLTTADGRVTRIMPFSVYQHYCVELLHARILQVHESFGREFPFDVSATLEMMRAREALMPKEIHEYLRQYGEFKDSLGNNWRPNLPDVLIPAATEGQVLGGHFTRVTAQNHNAYETNIAPLVSAQRIRAEIAGAVAMDPLPGLGIAVPTRNLLGYVPALTPLHRDAQATIINIDFSTTPVGSRFQHSPDVFNIAHNVLTEIRGIKTVVGIPTSINTNLAAFNFTETTEGAATTYLAAADVDMYGRCQLYSAEIGRLLMFTPRRHRTAEQPGYCSLTNANQPHAHWADNINNYFDMQEPFEPVNSVADDFINERRFRLPGNGNRPQLIGNWVKDNFVIKNPKK